MSDRRRPSDAWLRFPVACGALLWLLASAVAVAQLPTDPPAAEAPAITWQAPDLADLPHDWWAQIDAVSPAITQTRLERFFALAQERIGGLDPQNLVTAQASLENLRNLAELLNVAKQDKAEPQFEPIPTQSRYSLDDILALRDQRNAVEKDSVQTTLEIDQTERKQQLLVERRDRLLRRYEDAPRESPARIIAGLERITTRVEYEMEALRLERFRERLRLLEARIRLLAEQEEFARGNLDSGGMNLESLRDALEGARSRLIASSENMAGVQRQLLDVLSAPAINTSLQILRSQQMTRASAEAAVAQLEFAMAEARLDWYLLRTGQLDSDFDYGAAVSESRRITEDVRKQLDVWSSSSQATLVGDPPGTSPNAVSNFQIAQSVARETLTLIERVRKLSDDLLLVRDILATEIITTQSGLSKALARLGLVIGDYWERLMGAVDYNLFSMGDAPVTPGGIIKMILILALAWGISWLIRHLLERLGRRKQFANSPAIYTLGRLTHYLIITIGVFAALASIGIDFSNFALIAGALSVGIGFGLQAIVNNFVSGLILLFEGSLRVGDHIELDSGLAGVVREINTRATVVNTTDGVDVVVPNSELVTTKLTNWTLRESIARVRIGFGVAYGSDKDKVKEAALAAAEEMDFIILHMPGREPQVRLVNFGDSSLDFELLAWVSRQGVRRPHRVRASFLWALEGKLNEAGIEIPFPQRDLHIRSDDTKRA